MKPLLPSRLAPWALAHSVLAVSASAQVPDVALYRLFGEGCPSQFGTPQLEGMPHRLPRYGNPYTLRVSNLPPSLFPSQAIILFGFSDTDFAGTPLPMDLTPLGLLGCTGYVSVEASFLVSAMGTAVEFTFQIPFNPNLVGVRFFNQAVVQAVGANPFGAVVTNAAEGVVGPRDLEIIEEFRTESMLDREHSSGVWRAVSSLRGEARFGRIGGDGSHGEFHLALAKRLPDEFIGTTRRQVYELDTDHTVIPASQTLSGEEETISDGVFNFSRFVLPPLTRLRIVGSNPARIQVRGLVDIQGTIDLCGEDVPASITGGSIISTREFGQPGGAGGAGGGTGGAGGDKPDGLGAQPRFNGQDGGAAFVLAGHAYAAVVSDTRGAGSPMHPDDGLNSSIVFTLPPGFPNPVQSGMVASGGGGGGHANPGSSGSIDFVLSGLAVDRGQDGAGGAALPDLLPVPVGSMSFEHFLIGGSAGGGGGGHPIHSVASSITWHSGGGGAGGGGAIALRAGHRLRSGPQSEILATGGSGGFYDLVSLSLPPPAPGGGGSGGAIVLQGGDAAEVDLAGFMSVRGGTGTRVAQNLASIHGGDGSDGVIRVETPLPLPELPTLEPPAGPATAAELQDTDTRVGFRSRWYRTRLPVPPKFSHYLLEAFINGIPFSFSDDPDRYPGVPLAGPGEPLELRVQGAVLDESGAPVSVFPWRFHVGDHRAASGQPGLTVDGVTDFRFSLVLDRSVLGANTSVVVSKLTIVYEP